MNQIMKGFVVCCCCLVLGLVALAGMAYAAAAVEPPSAPVTEIASYDEFVFAAPVTSAVQAGCTSCLIIDACLDKHPNEPCKPSDPACRCKKCNGTFECYK